MSTDATEEARAASHWRDEFGQTAQSDNVAALRKLMELPPGTLPVKAPCEHDFDFLRMRLEGSPHNAEHVADLFYCRRCLEYREVKR